ncbi:MAG: DISARM system helicase DrmA, partial [Candidatus Xenobia bacterium]
VGPREGVHEVLPHDLHPRDAYLCFLSPRLVGDFPLPPLEGPATGAGDAENGEEDDPGEVPSLASLDPRQVPSSFGISFALLGPRDRLRLRIATTFARYFRTDAGWERTPVGHVTAWLQLRDGLVVAPDDRTSLHVRLQELGTEAWMVSVFFVNREEHQADSAPPVPSMIFQPELRIQLGEGLQPADFRSLSLTPEDAEDRSLELLYRDRPVLARGHLCAALWRDIDPEQPGPEGGLLAWADATLIAEPERSAFQCPDLRAAFVPLYNVASPLTDWDDCWGPSPELAPGILAQAWAPEVVHAALNPLVVGYRHWIEARRAELDDLSDALRPTGDLHLEVCSAVCERLQDAIKLLAEEPEVRLAFCFAQQAMHLQWAWRGRKETRWRSFQLAFQLLCLRGVADRQHPDRLVCDLLWFPTGGGKTEAYLGVIAFTLALRRLRAARDKAGLRTDAGVGVISRYTLRLLTIQQFRRSLRLILACDVLRVQPGRAGVGWRPEACSWADDWLWGTARFSAGLWVGGSVTPNRLEDTGFPDPIPGAFTLLEKDLFGHGEPAQVLQCPACEALLAIPQPRGGPQERATFPAGREFHLHVVVYADGPVSLPSPPVAGDAAIEVLALTQTPHPGPYATLSCHLRARAAGVSALEVDRWWRDVIQPSIGKFNGTASMRPSRPGYFARTWRNQRRRETRCQIEIVCPAPTCPTAAVPWREKVPVPLHAITAPDDWAWQEALPPFRSTSDSTVWTRAPISARTVDEPLYSYPPSLLVATVDKFARLGYEPAAGSLFGNVNRYHAVHGYYRRGDPPGDVGVGQEDPPNARLSVIVPGFPPPDLILQDELHLLDGPLGSMVGLYETVIDTLAGGPKYIASTATVRQAADQVASLFCRQVQQFPPPGLLASDNFFSITPVVHPKEASRPGRLYLGICTPGRGGLHSLLKIWSEIIARTEDDRSQVAAEELDPFWTVVGYFNAIRELAELNSLYRQEMPQRVALLLKRSPSWAEAAELSSRMDPLQLPALLNRLESPLPDAERVALATSMFGTGVDVLRLALMIVHGQPKTTSAYIQATGRVGRERGALVVTFFHAARPRDLTHYEFFAAYHSRLYQAVEPVAVAPFSPRARERALGPMSVALLRQAREVAGHRVSEGWLREQRDSKQQISGSRQMETARQDAEVAALPALFEMRAAQQPAGRRPVAGITAEETEAELNRWQQAAGQHANLLYCEYAMVRPPSHPVVLGDAQHLHRQLETVYPNAPQSLREVEAPTGFKV